jgi:hypothetical protein
MGGQWERRERGTERGEGEERVTKGIFLGGEGKLSGMRFEWGCIEIPSCGNPGDT